MLCCEQQWIRQVLTQHYCTHTHTHTHTLVRTHVSTHAGTTGNADACPQISAPADLAEKRRHWRTHNVQDHVHSVSALHTHALRETDTCTRVPPPPPPPTLPARPKTVPNCDDVPSVALRHLLLGGRMSCRKPEFGVWRYSHAWPGQHQ